MKLITVKNFTTTVKAMRAAQRISGKQRDEAEIARLERAVDFRVAEILEELEKESWQTSVTAE